MSIIMLIDCYFYLIVSYLDQVKESYRSGYIILAFNLIFIIYQRLNIIAILIVTNAKKTRLRDL